MADSLYHLLANALMVRRWQPSASDLSRRILAIAAVFRVESGPRVFSLAVLALTVMIAAWPAKRVRFAMLSKGALRGTPNDSMFLAFLIAIAYGLSYRGLEMSLLTFLQVECDAGATVASIALSLVLLTGAVRQYADGKHLMPLVARQLSSWLPRGAILMFALSALNGLATTLD